MKNTLTIMLLVAVSASMIGVETVSAAKPANKPVTVKSQATKKPAGKVKLAKDPKPSAAEIRMAQRQAVMEKNYGRYIKKLVSKKSKKKVTHKKVAKKKVAQKAK